MLVRPFALSFLLFESAQKFLASLGKNFANCTISNLITSVPSGGKFANPAKKLRLPTAEEGVIEMHFTVFRISCNEIPASDFYFFAAFD